MSSKSLMVATTMLNIAVQSLASSLREQYDQISFDRKIDLIDLSEIITQELNFNRKISLNFICTHNSRRSQLAQIWMKAAAMYFEINGILSYSGGTEGTAFNPRMVAALSEKGFDIHALDDSDNPKYRVELDDGEEVYFSKKYDHPSNPKADFIAIMVCDQADESCPIVFGSKEKFSLKYKDPKEYDGTPDESIKYQEKVDEIGREMMFVLENTAAILSA